MTLIYGLIVCYALFAVLGVARLPAGTRGIGMLLVLATFQIYIPFLHRGGASLCILASAGYMALRPDALVALTRTTIGRWAAALLAVQSVSLVWSPDPWTGITWILTEVPFVVAFASVMVTPRKRDFWPALSLGSRIASLNGVLVIYFRLAHGTALAFYESAAAPYFVGPGAHTLFTTAPNNVLDPAKAGGLFVNGNVSSLYCGVAGTVALIVYARGRYTTAGLTAVVLYASVLFTGSKTGIVLLAAAMLYFLAHIRLRSSHVAQLLGYIKGVSALSVIALGYALFGYAASESQSSLGARFEIWSSWTHCINRSPILGNGFGGWFMVFPPYAITLNLSPLLPPHNIVLYTWSQSGVVAVIILCGLMASGLHNLRAARRRGGDALAVVAATVCAAWVVLHGMADNTTIFGDVHTGAILGAIMAVALQGSKPTWRGRSDRIKHGRPIDLTVPNPVAKEA